ncbi:WIZ protein, partial [Zosterops hypoxanthus]|nr:WIZ protein [Zosterops hypoxanthus]
IPQAALELKRTFRTTLKSTDPAVTSEEQQHQLRMTVPLVLLQDVNPRPKTTRKARLKPLKRKKKQHQHHQHQQHQEHLSTNDNFLLEDPLPLDVLLLEAPLESPLELEELLGSENSSLKSEERRCPYCPDRFHNGIGLANHVRGHLNRVGVSYNVRHFISAEEVKAIEQ